MIGHPFNPGELGADDAALTDLADELERSAATSAQPSIGFTQHVLAAIDDEPTPRRPWFAALGLGPAGPALRAAALGVATLAAFGAAIIAGGLIGPPRLVPGGDGSPTLIVTPTISPTPTASPSPTSGATATQRPAPSIDTATPQPTATAAAGGSTGASGTAEPSDDHGASGSDSGPGSGSGSGKGSDGGSEGREPS